MSRLRNQRGPWQRRRAGERGFTLIELVVVVLIIAVLAVIAIPSITLRMKDRQAQELTHRVAAFYRNARMRAMGRGAAVLVRFDSGSIEVREARLGNQATDANCAPLPASACVGTNWTPPSPESERVEGKIINPLNYPEVKLETWSPAGASAPALTGQLDVCFTPLGRAFVRLNPSAAFQPMTGTAQAHVYRAPGGIRQGLTRRVLLLPNGAARVAL